MIEEQATSQAESFTPDDDFIDSILQDLQNTEVSENDAGDDEEDEQDIQTDLSDDKADQKQDVTKPAQQKRSRATERVQFANSERRKAEAVAQNLTLENSTLKRQLTDLQSRYDSELSELNKEFSKLQKMWSTDEDDDQPAAKAKSTDKFLTADQVREETVKALREERDKESQLSIARAEAEETAAAWNPKLSRVQKEGNPKLNNFMISYQEAMRSAKDDTLAKVLLATKSLEFAPETLFALHSEGSFGKLTFAKLVDRAYVLHDQIRSKKKATTTAKEIGKAPKGSAGTADGTQASYEEYHRKKYGNREKQKKR